MKFINLKEESERCLLCKAPRCQPACPVNTEIPRIIKLYMDGRYLEAGEILFENNPMSAVCSLICPFEDQCMGSCIRGIKGEPIDFPKIENYISTKYLEKVEFLKGKNKNKKVAIVGSGPAGLTLAFILAKKGYGITIFEGHEKIGGVLRYGVPNFRLSNDILGLMEKKLIKLGVKFRFNEIIGNTTTVDDLLKDSYDAVFIGSGVWNARKLNIKGETLGHVSYAINYLKSPDSFNFGKKVIIIGAGNVAMDVARTAKRDGKEAIIVYRRSLEDSPATKLEIKEALEDGIEVLEFNSPVRIVEEGIYLEKTKYELDEDGNKKLVVIPNSEYLYEADGIVIAISQTPRDTIVSKTKEIEVNERGTIVTDSNGHTTYKGVFSSGDVVTGAKTVVAAVKSTKIVANAIEEYLEGK